MGKGWIGVDLDGTLAEYGKFQGHEHIGPPVPAMLARVKAWLAAGEDVRVMTARVSNREISNQRDDDAPLAAAIAIQAWCIEHIGRALKITCEKDFEMRVLYDDRAVAVEKNTGRILGGDHHIPTPGDHSAHYGGEVTFGGIAPCALPDCPTGKIASPGSMHWHAADLAKGDSRGLQFNLGAFPMGAIFTTPPEKPVLSCRRHVDCLRAPKGQLCCRDPECKQMDCQVPR